MTTYDQIAEYFKVKIDHKQNLVELPNSTRDTFAEFLGKYGFDFGVEIGVERGYYSETLLKANPDLYLVSVDPWEAYEGYRDHVSQDVMDKLYQEAKNRLQPFGDRSCIVKLYSIVASTYPGINNLDFVYIDGNHTFDQVVADMCAWYPKLRSGGILAGHDYIARKGFEYMMHVIPAVHGFMEAYRVKPLFLLGRKAKIAGEARESIRSWFLVKP